MIISSNISISNKEIKKYNLDTGAWVDDLSLPNLAYQNAKRFGKRKFTSVPKTLCYLKKLDGGYLLPRYYPIEGVPIEDNTFAGSKLNSRCRLVLRDYQQEFFECHREDFDRNTGILVEAPCGSGKTVCGIWISYMRGVKTLVLVPTYYLAQQWEERIREFTDASVHIVKSKDNEIPIDSDFTIVVMDLFNCRLLPIELIDNIGHVILDEAHRMGAETYIPILDEVPARYRTALTATFRRRDNAHRILAYHFGHHLKMESQFPKPFAYGVKTGVHIDGLLSKNKPYKEFLAFLDLMGVSYLETKGTVSLSLKAKRVQELREAADTLVSKGGITKKAHKEICSCLSRQNDYPYTVLDTYLNECAGRRKSTITLIRKSLEAGRTVLFLSKRKDVLKSLYEYFKEWKPMLVVSETNKRTDAENDYLQHRCRLILGVTQLAKEGLDIDRLDTLVIHLPMADTEQAVGRISRLCDGKKQPMCLYLLDDCAIAYAVFSKAKKSFSINAEYQGDAGVATIIEKL